MASEVVAQIPRDARRVVIRGTSGSGKTTLAARIAAVRGIPHVELDGVYHQHDWTPLSDEAFVERIESFADEERWVTCGNYRQVAPILLAKADTVVLLDLPKPLVMRRVLTRSLRRVASREELWNGNREHVRNLCSLNPETSVVMWAWTTHAHRHEEMQQFVADPPREGLRIVLVTSRTDERLVYAGLGDPARSERVGVR